MSMVSENSLKSNLKILADSIKLQEIELSYLATALGLRNSVCFEGIVFYVFIDGLS